MMNFVPCRGPFYKAFLLAGWIIFLLLACGEEDTPESCDFTEKLLNVAIDEQSELLYDDTSVALRLEALEAVIAEEEVQRQQIEDLINEARPSGTPRHHEPLSKTGKIALVQLDLLQRMKASRTLLERKMWWTLRNHLRWGEQVTERAFLQRCDQRIALQPESTPYQPQPLESFFVDGDVDAISQRNLYHAYSTPEEIQALHAPTRAYRFLQQKKGRGFSTGFIVEDIEHKSEWKVKIGWEAYREVLATRLAWGLGFYVDDVFHLRELQVAYDSDLEKLFDDKNRKIEDSLAAIVLDDGRVMNLIATPEQAPNVSGIYNANRSNIRYLVFKSVVLERRTPNIVRAGQWSFDALDNPRLRAIRLLGLLNFWLDNPDIKFDNNRIFLRCPEPTPSPHDQFRTCVENGTYRYEFSVHDLGLSFSPHPNDLHDPGKGNALDMRREANGTLSFRSNTRGRDVYAWRLTTHEDAVAFAERLAQLTETQLRQAVAASGYPYPALVLIVERLKARRNQFLQLVTGDRFPPLEVDLTLSHTASGSVDIGETVPLMVPQDGFILSNGVLVNDISLGNHGRHSEMLRE